MAPQTRPAKIGKYEVCEELGEGGFGCVYKAFDPQVGRYVAIKVLTVSGDADALARFQKEATAAGNLNHENIVTVYESAVYHDPPFIVMQYLEGSDLSKVIASHES